MTKLSFHFRDDGAQDQLPILFLHAFPLHSGMWDAQQLALAGTARCISFDVPGLGRSPLPLAPNMLEHWVDDVFALMDYLHVGRAMLCGLSMGGYIALRAVERDASRITGLVLANTQAGADSNEAKLKRADGIRKLRHDGVVAYVDNFIKVATSEHTRAHDPSAVAHARKLMLDSSIDGMVSGLTGLATRTDTTESLQNIAVPTCVIAGEHDAITPPTVMRAMSDKIRTANFHQIANAGHLSNLEAPEAFNRLLLDHVRRVAQNAT